MGGLVSGLFGSDKAAKRQERMLAEQERKADAVEAGQRAAREGGRGLLAYVDSPDEPTELGSGGTTLFRLAKKFGATA